MQKLYQFLINSIRSLSIKSVVFLTAISGFFTEAFLEFQNYEMTNFVDRAIGNASLYAVDTAKRSSVYYTSLLIFALTFVIGSLIVRAVRRLLEKKSLESSFKQEGELLFEFSLLQIFWEINMFSYLLREPGLTNKFFGVCLLIAVMGLLLFHSIIKFIVLNKTDKQIVHDNLTSPYFIFLTTVLTFVLLYPILMIVQTGEFIKISSIKGAAVYAVLFLVFTAALLKQKDINRIACASCPLLLSPIAVILGNEVQYTLARWISVSPKFIAGLLFLMLVLCSVYLYLNKKTTLDQTQSAHLFDRYAAPFILIDAAVLTSRTLFSSGLDFLHQGNSITPAQQLLQFGRIPFVDYWGATQYPFDKLFFDIINRSSVLDPLAQPGISIIAILLILISYFVLRQFIANRRWIVIALIFALYPLTNPYYLPAMLPLFVLKRMLEKRRFCDYAAFLGLSLLSFVWMPSAGKISVISTFVLTALCCSNKKDIFNVLKAFVAVFGISAFAYFALCYMRGYDLRDQITLVRVFSVIDQMVGPYKNLFRPEAIKFEIVLQYAFLPIVPLFVFFYCLQKKEKTYINYFLVFLAVASIICQQRSYGRHSLYEGPQYTLYFLLLFILPFILNLPNKIKLILNTLVITIGWIFTWGGTSIPITNEKIYTVQIHRFEQFEKRYDYNTVDYPSYIKDFLDTQLTKEQTFFENISAHLLYPITGRKSPFLHHSSQIIQTDSAQEAYIRRFENEYSKGTVPLIIMDGQWVFHAIDDIPAALATYKLCEWIYRHYKPWVIIDGFHFWLANNSPLRNSFPPNDLIINTTPLIIPDKTAIYKAGINNIEYFDIIDNTLIVKTDKNNAYITIPLNSSVVLPENTTSYITINCKTNRPAPLHILYDFGDGFTNNNSSFFSLITSDDHFLNIESPIEDKAEDRNLKQIRIVMESDFFMEAKGLTIETTNLPHGVALDTDPTEHFTLKKLPFVWANYDKNKVSSPILLSIASGITLEAKQPVELTITGDYKRDNGNYLYFEIDSPTENSLDVTYGANKEDSVTFDVIPGKNKYMVRISAQYNWMNQHHDALFLMADKPLTVETLSIMEGD